ncbi:MAG: DUF885 family protein [Desulfobacterales bacterium]|nr:DUF885 family protein [Desulfobacterales bacterium]
MHKKDGYKKVAESYFDYLAERFPVMCASDEFDFLPRAENAFKHYDKLDKFEAVAIEETIDKLKEFQKGFASANYEAGDLDNLIDLKLLQANAAGILIELDTKRSWQYNPLMYLKIAFIGLDHALIKPAKEPKEVQERALARLSAIPVILKQGMNNIHSVPETYYQASLLMAADCKQYLYEIGRDLSKLFAGHHDVATKTMKSAEVSLEDFKHFLKSKSPEPDRRFAVSTLEASLKNHFLSQRNPEEIFTIAKEEWQETLEQLEALQLKIDPRKTWEDLYHAYTPSQIEETEIIALYGEEIDCLRTFFSRHGFSGEVLSSPIEIHYTPTYLESVRSSASFAAAFSRDPQEKSYFYISTHFPRHNSQKTDNHLQKRLNREYKMLTAHETIPGHHFLDSFRRRLKNPIRRQIESPLFYEGWASYAEFMLIEYGYLEDPLELLVSSKRNLWRSARCQIDVGLTIGKLSENTAVDLLQTCGFAPAEASRQLDRFRLNPGYQLCYCYGSHEFKQLRKKYGDLLKGNDYYSFLLEGGELPFHLLEKRFENLRHLVPSPE